jgi:hypothetical protein
MEGKTGVEIIYLRLLVGLGNDGIAEGAASGI